MTQTSEVNDIVIEVLNLDTTPAEHDDLSALDGWDSVNQLRLLMAIESRLGVKVPLKEFVACLTVGAIAALVARAAENKRPANVHAS